MHCVFCGIYSEMWISCGYCKTHLDCYCICLNGVVVSSRRTLLLSNTTAVGYPYTGGSLISEMAGFTIENFQLNWNQYPIPLNTFYIYPTSRKVRKRTLQSGNFQYSSNYLLGWPVTQSLELWIFLYCNVGNRQIICWFTRLKLGFITEYLYLLSCYMYRR